MCLFALLSETLMLPGTQFILSHYNIVCSDRTDSYGKKFNLGFLKI